MTETFEEDTMGKKQRRAVRKGNDQICSRILILRNLILTEKIIVGKLKKREAAFQYRFGILIRRLPIVMAE